MARAKVCGINSDAAFDAAIAAGADWIGFNFFPPSPRFVMPAEAATLSTRHPGGPPRVGLFVDPTEATIAATLDAIRLDILQLYVSPARAAELRARFGLPVWRAVGVGSPADLPGNTDGADALLIESKAPPDASRPGGNALVLDWALLDGWVAPGPWLLAGGLTPTNVAAAIRATGTPAVDASSGVERARGVKDPALIAAFVAAAHAAR